MVIRIAKAAMNYAVQVPSKLKRGMRKPWPFNCLIFIWLKRQSESCGRPRHLPHILCLFVLEMLG